MLGHRSSLFVPLIHHFTIIVKQLLRLKSQEHDNIEWD